MQRGKDAADPELGCISSHRVREGQSERERDICDVVWMLLTLGWVKPVQSGTFDHRKTDVRADCHLRIYL